MNLDEITDKFTLANKEKLKMWKLVKIRKKYIN